MTSVLTQKNVMFDRENPSDEMYKTPKVYAKRNFLLVQDFFHQQASK